jgi:hypothetical protein
MAVGELVSSPSKLVHGEGTKHWIYKLFWAKIVDEPAGFDVYKGLR